MSVKDIILSEPLRTESGAYIQQPAARYKSWGRLNTTRDNVILLFHALTGNVHADEWWSGLFTEQGPLDTTSHFIICINILGSPYGSSSPLTYLAAGQKRSDFPKITIRDIARHQLATLDALNIQGVECAIGGSMGGMIALECALLDNRFKKLGLLATTARRDPWAIGLGHTQRQAIRNDAHWNNGDYDIQKPPAEGLSLARQIAMLSYRSHKNFEQKFARTSTAEGEYDVVHYLKYQGDKLNNRFDACCYFRLSEALDSHDIGRDRGHIEHVLESISIPCQIISISSDMICPREQQLFLHHHLPLSTLYSIDSEYGHDGFLVHFERINEILNYFLTDKKEKVYA